MKKYTDDEIDRKMMWRIQNKISNGTKISDVENQFFNEHLIETVTHYSQCRNTFLIEYNNRQLELMLLTKNTNNGRE